MTNNNFDSKAFRTALGTFTTGVTIITATAQDGTPVGITANSFNSVSLDPPLVLWSLAKNANSLPVFTESKFWNVHVLSVEQEALSGRFASRGEDKFAGLELDEGLTTAPLLPNCTARFQCRTAFMHDGGDHIIFIGEVLGFDQSAHPPLVFQSGQYALAALKPREEVRLTRSEPPPECSYTEDLLGYLLGRAHFQLVNRLQVLLNEQGLDQPQFFILSVLCIRDGLTLDDINEYIAYTGSAVDLADMELLIKGGHVVIEQGRYRLTADGREASLHQIAQAKAVEQDVVEALGLGDAMALKLLLKRVIGSTDPGLPDLWSVPA
ncbi:flavin reductase [Marinobacterium stanieri]|uniref:3-hydroxy-9,10-secoandrosta-1,3,5(10)-triene-9,17-dione monooxygenase reductase component n=1 Tax=Marinobacterium stanieri TaxID=49186 RepID=A0A1N6P372_9GAMM|nr:flavin reductase [Marinobacterium stanieri]SIP98795.1 3-hydroxy-9,10-secoandrosta-1,3,5(10)-triene-9,17-dione monooxygenase reductase component [Marinobacterium stanieri]